MNAFFQEYREGLRDAGAASPAPAIPGAGATATAVYREGYTIWRMNLTPAMSGLLDALCEGATLGRALLAIEAHAETPEALAEAERNMIAWFSAWVSGGFFAKLDFTSAANP